MFFGAGNIVFPLAMGQFAQDQNIFAIIGFLITAVGVPFIGLISMTLFDGDYHRFFERIGKIPGFFIAFAIMGLIGPFGAMPRVIALSYSTSKIFVPNISLLYFSFFSCVLIFLLTYKRQRILDILGYVLTPLLLISLIILIVKGISSASEPLPSGLSSSNAFFHGLQLGYNTMDLMGAFFFSSVVILCLKKELHPEGQKDFRRLITMTLKASCLGAFLLALVYIGSSYVAAYNSEILKSVPPDEILATLSLQILGPYAGIVAVSAVALACLTTAIALAAVFAEYLHEDITFEKIGYVPCLIFTLIATFLMSTLNFSGIMNFLGPILIVCYPALIVLSVVNLMYKLYGFKLVLLPVGVVFILSLIVYWI
jgi:LIVCS family branched-chain amino acid:cation transporter